MVVIAKIIGCCAFHLPLSVLCTFYHYIRSLSSLFAVFFFLLCLVHKSKYVCSRIFFALTTRIIQDVFFCIRCCILCVSEFWPWLYYISTLILMYRKWRWRVEDVNLWMRLTRNLCFVSNILWLTDAFQRNNFSFIL